MKNILKIDNSQKEFKLIPLVNSIKVIPEKGTPFTITNIGSNNISIIVKKFYTNDPRFNVSIEEWFGENEIPNNLVKSDNVSDYFVNIRIAKTEDPIQEKIFLSEKELYGFLVNQEVYSVTYTGAAIPDFLDYSGIISHKKGYLDLSIDNIININDRDVVKDGIYLQFC